MHAQEVFAFILAVTVVTVAGLVLIFRGPLGRAIAKRIEGRAADGLVDARMAELEQRLADLEHERLRVADLEERLDFTERLLSATNERSKEAPR